MVNDLMNFEGILLGAGAFLCIGLFHPLVIKAEYYCGRFLLSGYWLLQVHCSFKTPIFPFS